MHADPKAYGRPELVRRSPRNRRGWRRPLRSIVPAVITGAANDDPCAIGTYARAGAAFGFSFLWTAPVTFPMMAVTIYLCSKLSAVTGKGIAGVLRYYGPRWLLYPLVFGILAANVLEAGADIGAIAASLKLFLPVPVSGITVGIALIVLAVQTWGSYEILQKTFSILAVALFAYVGAAFLAKPHATEFLRATFLPHLRWQHEYLAMIVALIGTRLSPYMYFWESSQEVERQNAGRERGWQQRRLRPSAAAASTGMFFSNLIMYFVILCTAATLFRSGTHNVATAQQAAEALRPLAGSAASLLFALGIIGTGVIAVPVLTTGPAHALSEMFGWSHGLRKAPEGAPEFYAVITLSTGVALALGISNINAMAALFWSSIIMGLLAPPLMLMMMLAVSSPRIMGEARGSRWLRVIGWLTTATVTIAAAALLWSWLA